jgi:hypothetical protein
MADLASKTQVGGDGCVSGGWGGVDVGVLEGGGGSSGLFKSANACKGRCVGGVIARLVITKTRHLHLWWCHGSRIWNRALKVV